MLAVFKIMSLIDQYHNVVQDFDTDRSKSHNNN